MKRVAGALLVLVGAVACSGAASPTASDPLAVFAASSLADVLPAIDGSPTYQFAGSDELALQIREGAGADVYAAASPKYPLELLDEGLVEEPVVFATNELVLIVPANNPAGIGSVEDLLQPGIRLVIGAAGVPVGDYTRAVLANLGAGAALESVVSEEQDARGVLSKVRLGEADAGFVYATDVEGATDVTSLTLPDAAQPTVEYMVAVVADGDRIDDARAFVDLLSSPEGRDALGDAGFGLP